MIFGVGNDIVQISRIEALLNKNKQRFLQRIFTLNEREIFKNISSIRAVSYVAKRFAAKEAFAKAFGTGIGSVISFQDIEVFSNNQGKPYFKLSTMLEQNYRTHLSMSDEKEYAQAFVVIEFMGI